MESTVDRSNAIQRTIPIVARILRASRQDAVICRLFYFVKRLSRNLRDTRTTLFIFAIRIETDEEGVSRQRGDVCKVRAKQPLFLAESHHGRVIKRIRNIIVGF